MILTPRFTTRRKMAQRVHVPGRSRLPTTHRALALCVSLMVLLTAGCDQAGSSTELSRPTTPPVKLVPFSGTLQPLATDTYTFTVSQSGYVEVTLLGLGAPSTTTVGLAVGNRAATGACSPIYSVTTAAGPAAQIVGTGLAGTLCVSISDVGNLTGPTIYTITVASS
jgi:hypothetical protein